MEYSDYCHTLNLILGLILINILLIHLSKIVLVRCIND